MERTVEQLLAMDLPMAAPSAEAPANPAPADGQEDDDS